MIESMQSLLTKLIRSYSRRRTAKVRKLFEENDFFAAYSAHTDMRVEGNPHEAVGGLWEELGNLQFNFLVDNGLLPQHTLLDIGCGTLRGGRHFIRYLDPGNYYGIDISPKAIEYGHELVKNEELEHKKPNLRLSVEQELTLNEVKGKKYDYILAQSVFTHLAPSHIEVCFQNVDQIMHDSSVFYFTFKEAPKFVKTSPKSFQYSIDFFTELAEKYRFLIRSRAADYPHPRNQHMMMLTLG